MLIYTGLKEDGQKLYQNAITGDITTIEKAEFTPSQRRLSRGYLNKPRHNNNRKSNKHRQLQAVRFRDAEGNFIKNKRKFVIHSSRNALERKALKAFKEYGIVI